MEALQERLRALSRRREEIGQLLSLPSASSDPETLRALMKELNTLTPVTDEFARWEKAVRDAEGAQELLDTAGTDRELSALAFEEKKRAEAEMADSEQKIRVLLLPRDPDDCKNVIVEIRAAAGGEEAALFAADLYEMYCRYAALRGFKTEKIGMNQTELGGYREITFSVSGEGAYSRFRFESGVHRVQRVPKTESQGRIQTSTVTVAVLPEAEAVDVVINPADLSFESMKSSGAGGQHINKTESAVRLTYKPTGLVVECDSERSQFQNKETALRMLRSRLYADEKEKRDRERSGARRSQVGSGDRSEKIRTYNFPQSRVTDHRIGYTSHSLDAILGGDIEELVTALLNAETAEKMKNEMTNDP